MGLFGSQHVIGIDLGYSSIKAVGLTLGKEPRLTGFAEIQVEPRSLQKEGLDDPTEAVRALKDALKMAIPKPITGHEAYVSVSETAVFRKILELPADIPVDGLSAAVRSGVVEFLPDDIESLELDYQPLPTAKGDVQQIMVVAVSKRSIEQYLNLCSRAGLQVQAIDPKPSALLRACVAKSMTEPVAIVDIGSEMSSVSICAAHAVWVAGTVNLGGNLVKDMATGSVDLEKNGDKLKRLASSLADELDHVVKFYTNRAGGQAGHIKEVRLTGGGSLIKGFDELFAKETGMEITHAKPTITVPTDFDRRFLGALGSAMYPLYQTP